MSIRKFTKEIRQGILDDYAKRHGGFDAAGFLREVRASNGTHKAWSWFEWDDGYAAEEYRLHQARLFVQGLRVRFEIVSMERSISNVTIHEAPAYVSPVDGRRDGGGYFQTDMNDPEHVDELRRQAARALRSWIDRYGGVLAKAGGEADAIRAAADLLQPPEKREVA